jgi:DNA-binding ferritin-like protein
MFTHYGEIRGTEGTDGDKLDVYVGDNHDSSLVVVIHQHNPWDGQYDEDKVILGCESVEEAIGLYKKQYDRPGFFKDKEYTVMPIGAFWRWVNEEKNKGKRVKLARVASALVLRITMGEVANRLKKEPFRLDRHDPSYETRMASFYAVNIHQQRHTGTKKEQFQVVWYTGNPAHRWSSKTVTSLKDAVTLANQVKPEADRISAEELGESPEGKLAAAQGKKAIWKKGYAEGQPGAINHAKETLSSLLVYLRALSWMHTTYHWQITGVSSYGDHQLFERLYGQTVGEIDQLAEKLVGTFGASVVDGPEQAQALVQFLPQAPMDPLVQALEMERVFQMMVESSITAVATMGQLSLGMDDLLRTIANNHETHIYLLQQRLEGPGGLRLASSKAVQHLVTRYLWHQVRKTALYGRCLQPSQVVL